VTTTTIFGDTGDGGIASEDATYATAGSGAGLIVDTVSTDIRVGQRFAAGTYRIYEAFLAFDTSAIGSDQVIESVELSLKAGADFSDQDFTIQVRPRAWLASGLTSADWVPVTSLSGLTLLATFETVSWPAVGTYAVFTSEAAFTSALNLGGMTELVICSSRSTSSTAPAADEYVRYQTAKASGTSDDPQLVVVHSDPPRSLRVVTPTARW